MAGDDGPSDYEKMVVLESLSEEFNEDIKHVDECLYRLLEAGVSLDTAEEILRNRELQLPPQPHKLRRAANEVEKRVTAPRDEIEKAVFGTLGYKVPIESAVDMAVKNFDRTYDEYGYYEPFDEWSGEYPLPKIDSSDWVPIWDTTDEERLQEIGEELQGRYRYIVYCLVCDIEGPSLPAAREQAKQVLEKVPSWLDEAYSADGVFYIGQTEDLSSRLRTHCVGDLSDTPPPAYLTRISEIATVGIVARPSEREKAENIEELYAENLSDVLPDSYHVHYGQNPYEF